MAVIAQRDGVRVVAFQKCGHTSIINMFMTPADQPIVRGAMSTAVINSGDAAAAIGGYRGDIAACKHWPEPRLTLAFYRNPITRALSAYQHFFVRNVILRRSLEALGFKRDMTFPEFCTQLQLVDLTADNHIKPQSVSLLEAMGASQLVVLYQLEALSNLWPSIVDELELDCSKEVVRYNAAEYETAIDATVADQLLKNVPAYEQDLKFWNEARTAFSPISRQAS